MPFSSADAFYLASWCNAAGWKRATRMWIAWACLLAGSELSQPSGWRS